MAGGAAFDGVGGSSGELDASLEVDRRRIRRSTSRRAAQAGRHAVDGVEERLVVAFDVGDHEPSPGDDGL